MKIQLQETLHWLEVSASTQPLALEVGLYRYMNFIVRVPF